VFNNVTIPTFTTGSDRFFIMREATFGKVLSDFSDPFELRPAASTPARHARLGRGLGIGL
jgi:hypothetical protein